MQSRVESATKQLIAEGYSLSKYDLAEKVFCEQRTAQRTLGRLHKAKVCSIVAWTKAHHQWIPVYGAKRRGDKPKPKPISNTERNKRFKKRHPEYVLGELMQQRAKRLQERMKCVGSSELHHLWLLDTPTLAPLQQS